MSRLVALLLLAAALPAQTLTPKALPQRPPATLDELRAHFPDPPADYRPMPLWVWNDDMQPARMAEMLRQYKQQGLGGAFVHPRPGLITEYLSPEWFRLWRSALDEGKRLGLQVNIYDENSYPSGFAGGHVPANAPDTASQYVVAETNIAPSAVNNNPLNVAFFAIKDNQARRIRSPKDLRPGESATAFRLRRASGNPWTGEFPYVDLTNPRTTPEFLKTTYDAYLRNFGPEFGKTVKYAFTDEPLIATAGAYDSARLSLPLSFYILSEFQRRHGYDLADHIPALFWDLGDFTRVRFDYWQTLHDLWKENFMRPMFDWNDAHGLQFTGHWMEHEWPFPWITPADASLYAFEHVPGIDMLEGTAIRTQGKDPHMLFTIRQVASVSNQLGRRAFCEAYGVAGWDSTFEHYKRFGDWLLVHGVNFIDQHLSFTTISGARKRDHPQSFSDVSPWWPYYRLHADHLARVSYLSSLSAPRHRVLLLQQTTTGFLYARRGAATPELNQMRAANADLNQFLADHQIDYDLGDEYILEWFGKVDKSRFVVGKASYELLVLPKNLDNLRHETLPLLEAWLKAGGRIISLSEPPAYVDGRLNAAPAELARRFEKQWRRVYDAGDLLPLLPKPRIAIDAPIGFSERFLASGDRILFLTNTTNQTFDTRATLEAGSLELWDTVTGKSTPAAFTASGNTLTFPVKLAPAGSMLLVARTAKGPAAPVPAPAQPKPLDATWTAKANSPNVLVLDYCDLKIGRETWTDVNTWQANWTLWQRHGFERPAWDNAVQFKKSILDRNHFARDSGFSATFRFTVEPGVDLKSLRLAVEKPELYRIQVNGLPLSFQGATRWLDPHLLSASLATLAHPGENVVTISASPFDVHMELENVYVSGAFGVKTNTKGHVLTPESTLSLGSWSKQGRPFYSDTVTYSAPVTTPSGTLAISLGEWNGSLAAVEIDGKPAGQIAWQPWRLEVPVTAGKHLIALKIVSTPRNQFGPFHHPEKPRMRAWPAAWAQFPEHQPSGDAYDVLDYGLFTAPRLEVTEK